jgi:hypothetical protein
MIQGMMNWKVFGRKLPWPNWGCVLKFAGRSWKKSSNASVRIADVLAGIRNHHFPFGALPLVQASGTNKQNDILTQYELISRQQNEFRRRINVANQRRIE